MTDLACNIKRVIAVSTLTTEVQRHSKQNYALWNKKKIISEISTFSSHRHKFKTQKQLLGHVQILSNNYNTKDKNVRVLSVDSAFANKVSIPETCCTVYRKCALHQSHKVMQDKKGKDSLPGKAVSDSEQRGCMGR